MGHWLDASARRRQLRWVEVGWGCQAGLLAGWGWLQLVFGLANWLEWELELDLELVEPELELELKLVELKLAGIGWLWLGGVGWG